MLNAKALTLIQILLLSLCVFAQVPTPIPTPNATLYIPGEGSHTLSSSEFLVASEVTAVGSTTSFQVVDHNVDGAAQTATFTVGLSPSGANYHFAEMAANGDTADVVETCTFDENGISHCTLVVVEVLGGTTITGGTSLTEPTSGLPVVALNFGGSSSSSSSATVTASSSSSTTTSTMPVLLGPSSSIVSRAISFASKTTSRTISSTTSSTTSSSTSSTSSITSSTTSATTSPTTSPTTNPSPTKASPTTNMAPANTNAAVNIKDRLFVKFVLVLALAFKLM